MADKTCVQRLQKEFKDLLKEPVPQILARPSPSNILDWHFVLEGSKGTAFEGGVYHGKLRFPSDFPFRPPGIRMITPNGRFHPEQWICMSMSDFHPETWNPLWGVSSILAGLLSYMVENQRETGSVLTTDGEKKKLASSSLAFNAKSAVFRQMFPEYVEKHLERQGASEFEAERLQNRGKSPAAVKQPASQDVAAGSGNVIPLKKGPRQKQPASQDVAAGSGDGIPLKKDPRQKQPASQDVAAASGNGIPLKKGPRQKKPHRFQTWLKSFLVGTRDAA